MGQNGTRGEDLMNVVRMIVVCVLTACAGACFTYALMPAGVPPEEVAVRMLAGTLAGLLVGLAIWAYAAVQVT